MWTGPAVCVLLLIVDVASVWWLVVWASQQRDRVVSVYAGRIELWTSDAVRHGHVHSGWHRLAPACTLGGIRRAFLGRLGWVCLDLSSDEYGGPGGGAPARRPPESARR
jgi:hypothetical protein